MFIALSYAFALTVFIGIAASLLHPGRQSPVEPTDEADERLATADDIVAACTEFDRMLLSKGLLTGEHLQVIRHGVRSRAVVTGMRATGATRDDHREVELDVMVKRVDGGQFPAHETTLIPASSLTRVTPGSVIETYYRSGDESAVVVCVPPA